MGKGGLTASMESVQTAEQRENHMGGWYPTYYYNRDPKRHHHFDNHPYSALRSGVCVLFVIIIHTHRSATIY